MKMGNVSDVENRGNRGIVRAFSQPQLLFASNSAAEIESSPLKQRHVDRKIATGFNGGTNMSN